MNPFHRHNWQPHPKKDEVEKTLNFVGIYPQKIEECTKCHRVRVYATTIVSSKVKISVLDPFPEEESYATQ
jgi:hypothetical protein